MTVLIYSLSDPETNQLRYVGKTIDLKARMATHLSDRRHVKRNMWIRSMASRGVLPLMEELEVVKNSNDEDWQEVERWWIAYLRFIGCDLCNLDSGGIGGKRRSIETREKIAASHTGKKLTDNHRSAMARAKLGTHRTEATKEKIRSSLTGVPKSESHRLNSALGQRGKKLRPESIAKRTATRYRSNQKTTST